MSCIPDPVTPRVFCTTPLDGNSVKDLPKGYVSQAFLDCLQTNVEQLKCVIDQNSVDTVVFEEDFLGSMTLLTTASQGSRFVIADTSAAGTPTYTVGGVNGEATLAFDAQAEVQNVCLYFGDVLNFDIDQLGYIEFKVKMGQAALDATSSVAFGLASARNDDIDTLAEQALFRVVGATDTTAVVVETDDGTNDNSVAAGTTLINAYKTFRIDFSAGTADVRFYVDDVRVASGTTFDMSNYTGALQPYVQIQKTADANTDSVVVDKVTVVGRRV